MKSTHPPAQSAVYVMSNDGLSCVGSDLAITAARAAGVVLHKHGDGPIPRGELVVYRAEPGWFGVRRTGTEGRILRRRSFDRALTAAQRIASA
ncbi:hypothetical protein U2261_10485 [Achromobacter xylosoxidans]|uniref:hypothetical protein n=1 Tax=Alcaligenes xylosoxydans xylosoxydans TaxID=85698 RepID=UPI00244A2691|nr:hypothetical protein [Achromobacter xylosoxidans]MDH0520840.1 hypothetical protein [Achromobacter xylosoxidans]MDH0544812.1 hypothetical protein [Achromobacter xylosoxidans]MDZ5615035.1 hypothetical protein [Achromobacter xylosoxidans]MDZ5625761.1 hypothetical protein [Achromobacter xylosoxidans]MDZ5685328.1 hypothetical protein [Achromobacter xylosoxidans]